MSKLLFGTAGVPRSAPASDTISGIECIKRLGLDCMEIEFVRGIHINPALAKKIKDTKEQLGIQLTVHAPYFINLASKESAKVSASIQRILDSARIAAICGAQSLTFHSGFYQNRSPFEVYQIIKTKLQQIINQFKKEKITIELNPELTGKRSQFGSLEELVNLSQEIKGVGLCLDIAHLHARTTGQYNSYQEFANLWQTIKDALGSVALNNMHLHISGIKYSTKGEVEHLNLKESDFNYSDFVRSLKDYKISGWLISESPNLEGDALLLKKTYEK